MFEAAGCQAACSAEVILVDSRLENTVEKHKVPQAPV